MRCCSVLLLVFAAACGDNGLATPDSPPRPGRPDARAGAIDAPDQPDADTTDASPGTPDARPPDASLPDGNTVTCTAPSGGYGSPVVASADQLSIHIANGTGTPNDDFYAARAFLNTDFDEFQLQLYAGFGAFSAGGVTTGTFPLAGDELDFATCGVCAFLLTDALDTDADGVPDDSTIDDLNRNYFATAGSVSITSLAPNLTGTVNNLVLDHVTIDATTLATTVVGDCSTTITSMAFDSVVTELGFTGLHGVPHQGYRIRLRPN